MSRGSLVSIACGAALLAIVWWVADNTYWADTKVPMPPSGEARVNPFYAAQRFAEALGARTAWDRVLITPPPDAVIVLSAWHWDLSTGRREALERWVEAGGRVVVDRTMAGGEEEFERWSGIAREYRELDGPHEDLAFDVLEDCRTFHEEERGGRETPSYRICDAGIFSYLTTTRPPAWTVRDEAGIQAVRVAAGRGSVTVVNADPFRFKRLLDGDHGRLFVAAAQLRRGDEVHFLSEDTHPSLLALLWQHASPAVTLALALVGLMLWRGGVRFGPLAPEPLPARRSLAEQIRGTGTFALRDGDSGPLHAAAVRALDEAAQRRAPRYASLSPTDRAAVLARLTGFERDALLRAIHNPVMRRVPRLRSTIALLETARRRTLAEHTRSPHGKS